MWKVNLPQLEVIGFMFQMDKFALNFVFYLP